jgi:hypothetical protein
VSRMISYHPPWENATSPKPFHIRTRGDPALTVFRILSREAFDTAIHHLRTSKDPSPDGIPNELIKHLPAETHTLLTLFSANGHRQTHPPLVSQLNMSTTQIEHSTDLSNYHPITLMNTLLKLWIALIKGSGMNFAESFGILSAQTDGLRGYKGTLDALSSSLLTSMENMQFFRKHIYLL